jgi:hypothetical protein
MPRKPILTDEQIEQAADDLRRGRKTRNQIAAELGVSPPAVSAAIARRAARGELRASRQAARAPEPAPEPEVVEVEPTPVKPKPKRPRAPRDDADLPTNLPPELAPPAILTLDAQREWYTTIVRTYTDEADTLRRQGETEEARKVLDIAVKASNALLRINRDGEDDQIRISRDEIKAVAEGARAKLRAYLETQRPLLCAHCNRELSVKWGRGAL